MVLHIPLRDLHGLNIGVQRKHHPEEVAQNCSSQAFVPAQLQHCKLRAWNLIFASFNDVLLESSRRAPAGIIFKR